MTFLSSLLNITVFLIRPLYFIWSEPVCLKSLYELLKCSPYISPVILLTLWSFPLQMHMFLFSSRLKGRLCKFLGPSLSSAVSLLPHSGSLLEKFKFFKYQLYFFHLFFFAALKKKSLFLNCYSHVKVNSLFRTYTLKSFIRKSMKSMIELSNNYS